MNSSFIDQVVPGRCVGERIENWSWIEAPSIRHFSIFNFQFSMPRPFICGSSKRFHSGNVRLLKRAHVAFLAKNFPDAVAGGRGAAHAKSLQERRGITV
jgi:hypothetical protein